MSFSCALREALPHKWKEGVSSFLFAILVVAVLWLLRRQMVRDEVWLLAAILVAASVVYGIRLIRVLSGEGFSVNLRTRAIPLVCVVLLALVAGVTRWGFSSAVQAEVERIAGVLPPERQEPEQAGNRVVQIHRHSTSTGEHRLSVEFGVNHTATQLGYAVGLTFEGQSYIDTICTFSDPEGGFVWNKNELCLSVSTEVGDSDRLHVQPLSTLITPRRSLYMSFRSAAELIITDCFFRLADEAENVGCGSSLIELIGS